MILEGVKGRVCISDLLPLWTGADGAQALDQDGQALREEGAAMRVEHPRGRLASDGERVRRPERPSLEWVCHGGLLLGKRHRLETACDRKEHTRTDGQAHRWFLLWHDRRVFGCRDGYGSGTPVVELNHHLGFAAP